MTSTNVHDVLMEDLRTYLHCRRCRIVRQYVDACQHKGPWLPIMRPLFSPSARDYINSIEWSMRRVLSRQAGDIDNDVVVRASALIVSYLPLSMFPPFPTSTKAWVEGVRDVLGRSPFSAAALASPKVPGGPTPSRLVPVTPGGSTKRPREEEFESPPFGRGPLSEPSGNSMPPLELSMQLATPDKRTRTPPPLSPGTALTATVTDQVHFYLRPPFHDTVFVFSRMLTASMLNDDEMNRFFGRFGQVNCKRVRCEAVTPSEKGGWTFDATSQLALGSAAALSTGRSMSRRGQTSLWLQDFIIEVDLPANALLALEELRDPAILFIAPSHPDRNLYTSADLDAALAAAQESLAVVHIEDATVLNDDDAYIPDLVVDRVPYWYSPDQFAFLIAAFGEHTSIRYSVDDKSGAFTGAVLLTMATAEGVRKAAHGLQGKIIEQDQPPLVCGVLNDKFQIESLLDPEVVLLDNKYAEPLLRVLRCSDGGVAKATNKFVNPRLWL